MSVQLSTQVFDFLQNIEENNNREWFLEHKDDYNKAFTNVERFVSVLIQELSQYDITIAGQEAKKCIYRIYRDLRFSPDKRPYKTHFGAYIAMGGKSLNNAGYYVHIQNNMSMIAAGLWCPESALLKKIREELYYGPEEMHHILQEKNFVEHWGCISDEDNLKKVPQPYPKDFEYAYLLKYKSFCAVKPYTNAQVCAKEFMEKCINDFIPAVPLINYMNYLKHL